MRNKLISALIGVAIGLPLSVCAAEARPGASYYVPPVNSYPVTLPDAEEVAPEVAEEADTILPQADMQLLACLVEAEAGNQDMTGKRLVVDVVLNRVADPRFPDTVAGVVYQRGQFSPVSNGALANAYYTVSPESMEAVELELLDQINYDVLFFNSDGYGYGTPAFRYGAHYFSK